MQRIVISATALSLLAAALTSTAEAQPRPAGTLTRNEIAVKGMQRTFLAYAPRNLKANAPLLFVFHGSGGDGAGMREVTGNEFDALADANGFLVVYPDGYQTTWNDCRKASPQPARRLNIDDESFIEAMIAKETADHAIDRKRVFAAGWSNGGQLAYRLAMERPTQFAAVAAISASVPTAENLACTPLNAPMPVMIVNGTADPINPFGGGNVMLGFTSLGPVLSADASAQYFAKLNGIAAAPVVTRLPHKILSDPTWVEQKSWAAPGKPGVVLYAVHGGGHVVPQRYFQFGEGQTQDLDAPVAIWDFFAKIPSKP
jgi:polyhydroxybutyrate depolymerase